MEEIYGSLRLISDVVDDLKILEGDMAYSRFIAKPDIDTLLADEEGRLAVYMRDISEEFKEKNLDVDEFHVYRSVLIPELRPQNEAGVMIIGIKRRGEDQCEMKIQF